LRLPFRFLDVSEVSMDRKADSAFMRQFAGVIAGFVVLTIALIFLARYIQPESATDANPSQGVLAEQRIRAEGSVRYGYEAAAALAEAQAAPATSTEEVVVDGAAVYNGLCVSCHAAGVAGAPIPGSEQFVARQTDHGLEAMVQNAINGLNAMPPRGGNPSLTDAQIQAAVEFMLQ
jgi:cytochrome c5